ncbi:MAG: restriction endonuclease [Thermoanaerobaculia bacterium]
MHSDFQNLDSSQFELLCGSLLAAEGFLNVSQFGRAGEVQHGVDFVFDAQDGKRWVAQVKHVRHRLSSPSILQRIVGDLQRGMELLKSDKGLLMVSVPLGRSKLDQLHLVGIEIWDATTLEALLAKHRAVRGKFLQVLDAERQIKELFQGRPSLPSDSALADSLIARLESIQPGKPSATKYEKICTDILSYSFSPSLRAPKVQRRSEDGLDRRDAVFPIGSGSQFWDDIKYGYSSRLVVAEFKNSGKLIGQKEVESLQQYLFSRARRAFGLLCSRLGPSKPALTARRRAWMMSENLILFLTDGDLKDLVRMKLNGEDPTTVLDAGMDEFFLALAP